MGVLRVVVDDVDGGGGSEEGVTPAEIFRSETGFLESVLVVVELVAVDVCACSILHRLAASMDCCITPLRPANSSAYSMSKRD